MVVLLSPDEIERIKTGLTDKIKDFKSRREEFVQQLEANTETKLIEPLFKFLGWTDKDFEKQKPAHRGDKSGHADYAFKINDRIVFMVEVKRVGVPLEREADKQVISYALSKRVPFAISTNFEMLKIFCVEEENAINHVFRVFKQPEDYIENIHDLLYLHKESFKQNLLIKQAEIEERLKKRISIDKPILDDLMNIRNMVVNDIEKRYPNRYELNIKEEIVQRIIGRLIFIRKCEDVGINPEGKILSDISQGTVTRAYASLKELYKQYDEIYNGGLFAADADNECDNITIDGEIVRQLCVMLYESKDKQYIYNFDWIDADILGLVYEQYLGKILAQTQSGKSKLKNGQAHRKEQGIYYTPTHIVDYIVRNALGAALKNNAMDVKQIKVLDPACGSGSFLIKAFDYLKDRRYSEEDAKLRRIDGQGMYSVKTEIIKNNLYGIDLDIKAVEITKLNLLLKAAEKNRKLPSDAEMHIRCGNSLIDDDALADASAFKWVGDFKEETFDVVIGNPPYISAIELNKNVGTEIKDYWKEKYNNAAQGAYDIYILFFEQALRACKEGGIVSFITPNKYLSSPYGAALRKYISENFKLLKVVDLSSVKVFDDPSVYPIITLIQKIKKTREHTVIIERVQSETFDDTTTYRISSKVLDSMPDSIWGILLSDNNEIITKIMSEHESLCNVAEVQATSTAAEADEYSKYIHNKGRGIPIINTGTIDRYSSNWGVSKFVNKGERYERPILDDSKVSENRNKLYHSPKIIVSKMALCVEAFLDSDGGIASINTNCIHSPKKGYSLEYLAGVINSKLMSFVYAELFSGLRMSGGYFQFQAPQLRILPIARPSDDDEKDVVALVEKIQTLNRRINLIGDKKTADRTRLENEIRRLDGELDAHIYSIYKLTKKERNAIEASIKLKTTKRKGQSR